MKFHVLILFFLIIQTPLIAMGDRRLIETTCKATPSYNLCLSTLLANPKSSSGNVKDLALIMVGAAGARATRAIQQIKSMYNSHPELKQSLKKCELAYMAVVQMDVPSVDQELNGGQPKPAMDVMGDTAAQAQACERGFSSRGQASPLTQTNKDVEDVGNVAIAIIRLLL
ncbi:cell wall / vacuolar inhibitor of fructosidase 1-like [Bidens hawaiensis]|uniref:cell wall / vacuolar inhibitor of fructosidase 1-like n=1 Tax=Bidens hawaiensis TaxID=980011 RepID=UPI00404ACB2E